MGINCCARGVDKSQQLENLGLEALFPINCYIKESVIVPESHSKLMYDHETTEIIKPLYIPNNAVHCRVFASYDENQYNLWVDAGTTLEFYVIGEWYLFEGLKTISCEGDHDSQLAYNYPLGSLLGRVNGGALFQISNLSKYQSRVSGSLVLFQNNGSYETNPFGFLDVFIVGAKILKRNEIDLLLGWNITLIDTTVGSTYMSDKEKDLLILINKLRNDPKRFAQIYLTHLRNFSHFYENAFKLLCEKDNAKSVNHIEFSSDLDGENPSMLRPNFSLNKISKKHGKDLEITGQVGHVSIEGLDLQERLRSFDISSQNYSEICSFGKSCPVSIILQLIVDDDEVNNSHNRETIISGNFNHIGISIQNHKEYGSSCIITLIYLEDYS